MRTFRHLLVIMAMLSVALLTGLSHAMPSHDDGDTHVARQLRVAHEFGVEQAAKAPHSGDEHDCPDHNHGKCCVTACCVPSCLRVAELSALPAPRWTIVSIALRGDDVARAGAVLGLPKRPPKPV